MITCMIFICPLHLLTNIINVTTIYRHIFVGLCPALPVLLIEFRFPAERLQSKRPFFLLEKNE